MAIGTLWCTVLDVNDLAEGERFWIGVTGFRLNFSGWGARFSSLVGEKDQEILLQLVPEQKTIKNRAHFDFGVEDVRKAMDDVMALGGSVVHPLRAEPKDDPGIEWSVVADPFGNEFCVIRILDRSKAGLAPSHPAD